MALRKHNPDPDPKPSLNMGPLNFKIPIRAPNRDPNPIEPPNQDIDMREVYFLIMHFLSSGSICKQTYTQLFEELLGKQLLPRRYHAWYSRSGTTSGVQDDDGISLPLGYNNLAERYPHVGKDHLVRLLKQLIQSSSPQLNVLVAGPTCHASDVPTLLGSGSFSILPPDRYKAEREGTKLPSHLRWPHMHADQVRGLSLREIGGGFGKHHRAPSVRAACYAIAKPSTLVEKMKLIKKLRGHQNAVYCAIFDRSGRFVITGSDDRLVKIWSMETAFCLASCRGHEGDITDLAVNSNNTLVASSSNDYHIRVWRIPDGLPISVLKGHTLAVTAITFSPRPSAVYQLLSTSDDGTCRIWDARYSQQSLRVYVPKPPDNPPRRNGEASTSSSTAAAAPLQQPNQILCCAFNANGTVFVTGSSDTFARVWNACKFTGEEPNEQIHEMDLLSGHENDVNYVQFSGCAVPSRPSYGDFSKEDNLPKFKNSWFTHDNIVTCSRDGSAIIWIPRSRRSHGKAGRWTRAYHLKVPPPPMAPQPTRGGPRQRFQPTPRGVNMIVWSLDNRFVLAAIMDCRICVWNASDGSLVHSLMGHKASTFVLDVHPFNPRIAMSAGYDGQTIIWDIWEGKPVQNYEVGQFKLVDGKFSPDGTSIILSDEVGQIFILATGQGESQKDARYDQFFLGDYRPLARDANGNVLDQETQLQPYRRNIQDFLCDSTMIPYPEPYQSMYQRRRLGTLGVEWRPPAVTFAVGPTYNSTTGEFQNLPVIDLDIWAEPLPEIADVIDWEQQQQEAQQTEEEDLSDSEFNLTEEEDLSDGEEHEAVSVSSDGGDESERDADVSLMDANKARLRRSKRKKHKSEVVTSSGRRVKRRNTEEHNGQVSVGPSRPNKARKSKHSGRRKKSPKSKAGSRPKRRAARNALSLFSKMTASDGEEEEELEDEEEEEEEEEEYSSSEEDEDCMILELNESPRSHKMPNGEAQKEEIRERDGGSSSQFVPMPCQTERRRLILKLPRRDGTPLFASEPVKAESSKQDETETATVTAPKDLEPVPEPEPEPEPIPVLSGTGKKDEPEACVAAPSGTIRWGEVKQRSAKRVKLSDEAGPSDAYKPPVNNNNNNKLILGEIKSPECDDDNMSVVKIPTIPDDSREANDEARTSTSNKKHAEPVLYKRLRIKNSKPKLEENTNKSEPDELGTSQRNSNTHNNTEQHNETVTEPGLNNKKVRVVYTRNKPGKKRKEIDYNDESTSNSRDLDEDYDADPDEEDSCLRTSSRSRHNNSYNNNAFETSTSGRRSNRRETALSYGEVRQMERRRNIPVKKLSWLMLLEHEESYRYIPQMGDEVAYLRQGHEEYTKGSVRTNEPLPWRTFRNLKAVEFCKIQSLDYSTFSGSGEGCFKLTLEFCDPRSPVFTKDFKITLPELVAFPDFLVERARYEASLERNWTQRDKCQVWWRSEDGEGGSWWEGRIIAVKPKSTDFPDSPWEKYVIQYKNDASELHSHSPWELHDLDGQWYHPHIDSRTRDKLLSSISKLEHISNRNKDNYGIQKLNVAAQKPDFINRFPVQFSIDVIKRRLDNNYYRTIEAVKHDASVMLSSAESYFGRNAEMTNKMRRLGDWIERNFSSL